MTRPDSQEALEKFVDRVLREQPLRRAPADLPDRVLAIIEQRAARVWWQMSFNEWPTAARVLFILASIAIGALALEIPTWLMEALDARLPLSFSRGIALWQVMRTTSSSIASSLPMEWIYGIVISLAALYAAFFGVGAAAYRTLVHTR